ncbi:hypothetical protein DKY63_02725 [Pseudomonas putida]|uniref:Uncharacterized protein n=1 Tax=Pseudomonas putida TaxID=303 RepID=A0A2Z4RG08_PSEPU|nr:hypothetical protein DKY63_02725 [Pseudomonas putida]
MDANDNAGCLSPRGACASIASRLAPTPHPQCSRFANTVVARQPIVPGPVATYCWLTVTTTTKR